MVPASSNPRRFRLQFSLRGLLLAMLLAGVGITIYRWPWQETRRHSLSRFGYLGRQWWQSPEEKGIDPNLDYAPETEITYRRDWRGTPVKDGPLRVYFRGKLAEEQPYRHGQLAGTLRCFDYAGRVTCETSFREDLAHGPFRIGDGEAWVQTGHYFRGEEHGEWRTIESRQDGPPRKYTHFSLDGSSLPPGPYENAELPADPIVCRSNWRYGKRHGEWEWRTTTGELLNRAEYVDNRLRRWNGQLVNEPFQQWLAKVAAGDPVLLGAMQLPCTTEVNVMGQCVVGAPADLFVKDGGGEDWMQIIGLPGMSEDQGANRVLHYVRIRTPSARHRYDELTNADYLLEWALQEGLTFDFRYGGLWLIPTGECSGTFQDPTGVDKIRFEPGSAQAREWGQPVLLTPYHVLFFHYTLTHLFRDTSIALDFSDLEPVPKTLDPLPDLLRGVERSRRDVLGLLLFRMGLQCEQQGNKLIIKRHWTGLESFRDLVNENNSFSIKRSE